MMDWSRYAPKVRMQHSAVLLASSNPVGANGRAALEF